MNTSWLTVLSWVVYTDVSACCFHLGGSLVLQPRQPQDSYASHKLLFANWESHLCPLHLKFLTCPPR